MLNEQLRRAFTTILIHTAQNAEWIAEAVRFGTCAHEQETHEEALASMQRFGLDPYRKMNEAYSDAEMANIARKIGQHLIAAADAYDGKAEQPLAKLGPGGDFTTEINP